MNKFSLRAIIGLGTILILGGFSCQATSKTEPPSKSSEGSVAQNQKISTASSKDTLDTLTTLLSGPSVSILGRVSAYSPYLFILGDGGFGSQGIEGILDKRSQTLLLPQSFSLHMKGIDFNDAIISPDGRYVADTFEKNDSTKYDGPGIYILDFTTLQEKVIPIDKDLIFTSAVSGKEGSEGFSTKGPRKWLNSQEAVFDVFKTTDGDNYIYVKTYHVLLGADGAWTVSSEIKNIK